MHFLYWRPRFRMDRLCDLRSSCDLENVPIGSRSNARSGLRWSHARVVRLDGRVRERLRQAVEEPVMIEPVLGLVVAVGLGVYLLYTLLHPERF